MDSIIHEDLTTVDDITPFLKQCVGKGKEIPIGSLLQVQQITNISFPTYDKPNYDPDKHTIKIAVTDGQSQGYALVPDSCPGISLNTAPGTKIRTTQPIPVQGSIFVLTRNNCEVLGGRVAKLYEKWEIQKKMAFKHEWGYTGSSVEGEGPPPWKPFGYKPSIDVAALRKMKAMDVVNEKRDGQSSGSKSQFDMQRDEAISELQATANKQKFQKPNKHLLDKEITDIMDEGFSQNEAEYAMNRFKNYQKALKFLKESKKRQDGAPKEPPKPVLERKDRRKKGKGIDDDEEQDVPAEYQRPTKSISLFGFIEGQIKSESDNKPAPPQSNAAPPSRGGYGRSRDLEDSMGRMNIRESHSESWGGGGGRGRGYRGGGNNRGYDTVPSGGRDSYQRFDNRDNRENRFDSRDNRFDSRDNRFDKREGAKLEPGQQRPPRFQNRGGPDNRSSSDYQYGPPRNQTNSSSSSSYDGYRGQLKDNYDSGNRDAPVAPPPPRSHENSSSAHGRQNFSRNYQQQQPPQQQQQQQQQQQPRIPTGKDRSSYSSEYHQQHHQQYSQQSNDYPVPSQQTYQQHSYQQHHQQQSSRQQHMNANSSQNHHQHHHHEPGNHRGGRQQQQQPPPHYSNHSSGNYPPHNQQQPPPHSEFSQYQYGYEEWNPAQSLVFTRSKPDSRGRGGGGGSHHGSSRGASSSYNNQQQQQQAPPGRPSYQQSNRC